MHVYSCVFHCLGKIRFLRISLITKKKSAVLAVLTRATVKLGNKKSTLLDKRTQAGISGEARRKWREMDFWCCWRLFFTALPLSVSRKNKIN